MNTNMKSFTQLFHSGLNMTTRSANDDKKNIRPYKVKKAIDFLSLPEIRDIDAYTTKVKFLKTRGMNEDEIKEAFNQLEKSAALQVGLHAISSDLNQDEGNAPLSIALPQNQTGPISTVFSFCHKLLMFAGIATSCYYLYQQWTSMRTKVVQSKKEDATIKAELRQIKLEVLRIAGDLKKYQGIQENQTKLLAEINSLKAILTSRQYFEERKSTKVTMPQWQMTSHPEYDTATPAPPTVPVDKAQNAPDLQSSPTNGHVDGFEQKTIQRKSKSRNGASGDEITVAEPAHGIITSSAVANNNSCVAENENSCDVPKESNIKISQKKKAKNLV